MSPQLLWLKTLLYLAQQRNNAEAVAKIQALIDKIVPPQP